MFSVYLGVDAITKMKANHSRKLQQVYLARERKQTEWQQKLKNGFGLILTIMYISRFARRMCKARSSLYTDGARET